MFVFSGLVMNVLSFTCIVSCSWLRWLLLITYFQCSFHYSRLIFCKGLLVQQVVCRKRTLIFYFKRVVKPTIWHKCDSFYFFQRPLEFVLVTLLNLHFQDCLVFCLWCLVFPLFYLICVYAWHLTVEQIFCIMLYNIATPYDTTLYYTQYLIKIIQICCCSFYINFDDSLFRKIFYLEKWLFLDHLQDKKGGQTPLLVVLNPQH